MLNLLALGPERVGAGLAEVPAKAMCVRHVDVSMGTSAGSTMPGRGREEENLDPLQAKNLQPRFRWCRQTWDETGEVVRKLPWQKREPGANKKVGNFVALLSAKWSKESPASSQKHTGAFLPLT